MQNNTVHYCVIDYDQQFVAINQVCCRKVSFFKMAVHYHVIGPLDSWENWRDGLGTATTFGIQSKLSSK